MPGSPVLRDCFAEVKRSTKSREVERVLQDSWIVLLPGKKSTKPNQDCSIFSILTLQAAEAA